MRKREGERIQDVLSEAKIRRALEKTDGRVQVAARELGISRWPLIQALQTWAKHLAPLVKDLREEAGYERGRPPEIDISEAKFKRAWNDAGERILPCATKLGVSRDVVRRLAERYGIALPKTGGRPRKKG